jgi:hypothetical protein
MLLNVFPIRLPHLIILAWFSANAFVATITPVKNGGIPHFAELKLVFKEGGAFEFYNTYTALLDRLHAQGDAEPVDHLEDLPMYSNETRNVMEEASTSSAGAPPPVEDVAEEAPDDLPPSYDDVASEDGNRGRSRVRY